MEHLKRYLTKDQDLPIVKILENVAKGTGMFFKRKGAFVCSAGKIFKCFRSFFRYRRRVSETETLFRDQCDQGLQTQRLFQRKSDGPTENTKFVYGTERFPFTF